MQIVADRFAVTGDGCAIDLVTGARVTLKMGVGGGASEQTRWSVRCGGLHELHHRTLAPLLDYGAVGESQRFEAWGCGQRWHGAQHAAESALRTTSRFLRACGLTDGPGSAADVYESGGRAVVVPRDEVGYNVDWTPSPSPEAVLSLNGCGIATIERRADAVLADVFASLTGSRPHIISLWGPAGSGRTTAVLSAARTARLNGFVPVGVQVIDRVPSDLLKDRSLCLIDDTDDETRWSTLLGVALRSPRAHVLLRTGRDEIESRHGVGLEQLPRTRLAAAVRPEGLDDPLRRAVARAARLAQGLPGRFAEVLWRGRVGRLAGTSRGHVRVFSRIAEQRAVYGHDESATVDRHRSESRAWPAPGELAALRRRSEAASELLRHGRHAPGVRQLRQAIGGLARRRDWTPASESALVLASALLARGAVREAQSALVEAKDYAGQAGKETVLIDVAILSGHAWIDLARLDQAETVIGTALAAARRTGDAWRVASASLALGRCLFWKGEYAESISVLTAPVGETVEPRLKVRLTAAAARAAVGMGDLVRAMSLAREAAEAASCLGDPATAALASCAAAFVHLAVNDLEAVAVDAQSCIASARAAHDPMRAIRARLMLGECERRRGRTTTATALVRRIRRVGPAHLPPIVRTRVDLLHDLLTSFPLLADSAARHAGHTGLAALALYAADARCGSGSHVLTDSFTEELVGILHLCQTAEDETTVLGDVCLRLRRQLHAAAVAIVVREGATCSIVAADGARIDTEIAQRTITAGMTVAPHRSDDRLEAAAPVRYGGAAIGALATRWPLGTPYDLSRASAVLTMAATAAAPVVSAVLGRRSRPSSSAAGDLLGVTAPMLELRRAIEWSAGAPFAVLIEGPIDP